MNKGRGIFFIITGAVFWGIGGTVAKKLFQQYGIDMGWFVTIRLLIAGLLLLIVHIFKKGPTEIFEIWKDKKLSFQLLIFGLVGMLGVQYTYMASIYLYGFDRKWKRCCSYVIAIFSSCNDYFILISPQTINSHKERYVYSFTRFAGLFFLVN